MCVCVGLARNAPICLQGVNGRGYRGNRFHRLYIYISIYLSIDISIYLSLSLYIYIYIYIYINICIYIHIHIYIYMSTQGVGGRGYRGHRFHRLLPGQVLQGGKLGADSASIFGGKFGDEPAGLARRHDRRRFVYIINSCIHLFVCMCVYMYMYMYKCIYIYIYIRLHFWREV